jgi:hypothetical protein
VDRLGEALDALSQALQVEGRVRMRPFVPAGGAVLKGEFEVRSADGRVRRLQSAQLPLPAPLARAFARAAPIENLAIDLRTHTLTLWAPQELIELQVGHRWHGFSGRRMREWDERYIVFAEDGGDPLALRIDEQDGPVWLSHRGEGRHAFFTAAPDLASFYLALGCWLKVREPARLGEELRAVFAERASELWLWDELVSGNRSAR